MLLPADLRLLLQFLVELGTGFLDVGLVYGKDTIYFLVGIDMVFAAFLLGELLVFFIVVIINLG